jgi:hypothetical protein
VSAIASVFCLVRVPHAFPGCNRLATLILPPPLVRKSAARLWPASPRYRRAGTPAYK